MNEKIDIKKIILKLLSKWYYFLICALIVVPLSYSYVKYGQKVYKIQSSLLLKTEMQDGLSSKEFLKGMELFNSNNEVEDEIGILKSYTLIEKTVRSLDFGVSYFLKKPLKIIEMYGSPPFIIVPDSSVSQVVNMPIEIFRLSDKRYRIVARNTNAQIYDPLTRLMKESSGVDLDLEAEEGKPFQTGHLAFTLFFRQSYDSARDEKYYFVMHDLNSMVEDYQNKLQISPISRESSIVTLSIQDRIPDKTIRFLNKLMEMYLMNELNKKNQLGLKTIRFIDSQLSGVTDSLRQAEGSLESFRIKSNIQDISTTAETLGKNLNALETEKAVAEIKVKYYTYIATTLKEERLNDIVAPSTFGLEDPLLSSLLIELSKLSQERAALNYNAKDMNPISEVIDLKMRNTKKTLSENVKNILNVSSIAINDLDTRINKIKSQLYRLPQNERELVNIRRRFNFSDNVYNYLLEKRAEAGIAIASNTVDKAVVDRANIIGGGPVSPNSMIVYSMALILCIAVPVLLMLAKDFWNNHIVTPDDIEQATPIPFIGGIIHGNTREKSNPVDQKRSPLNESFQSLRVNLQYLTLGKEKSVIGFTSSMSKEGKTFCAVNLASAMAAAGKKTVLIDGDMRKPSVSRYLNFDNSKGLSNYLVGAYSLQDVIQPTRQKGFHVITAGPIPPNPLNLIDLPQMEQLIKTLRENYDMVILDAPPVGYVSEYIILMKYTDANIYVVRSEFTSRFNLSMINKLYAEKKVSNISILLNDLKVGRLYGYGYGYGAGYPS